jgi:hypothetical protein
MTKGQKNIDESSSKVKKTLSGLGSKVKKTLSGLGPKVKKASLFFVRGVRSVASFFGKIFGLIFFVKKDFFMKRMILYKV